MHTTTNSNQPTLRDLQQVMIRLQIKALETLERLMDDHKLTGNEKTDKAKATERNRQRMSATQTLMHCRTMQRELRERREQSHRIKQEERVAQQKAPHQLATLRRLHKLHPDEYNNPDVANEGGMAMQSMAMQGAESPQNPEDIAMPPEPPAPSPLEGEGGRDSGRMRGRSESSDHSACGMLKQSLSMSSPNIPSHAQTSLSMPHQSPKPFPTDIGKTLAAQIIAVAGSARGLHP